MEQRKSTVYMIVSMLIFTVALIGAFIVLSSLVHKILAAVFTHLHHHADPNHIRVVLINNLILRTIDVISVLIALQVLARFRRQPVSSYGLSNDRIMQNLVSGLLIGAGMAGGATLILLAGGWYRFQGLESFTYLPGFFVFSFFVAVCEEIVFRGVLFNCLESRYGTVVSALVVCTMFGVFHLLAPSGFSLIDALSIGFVGSLPETTSFIYTRSLWVPIGIHAGWDFTVGILFGYVTDFGTLGGLVKHLIAGPEWAVGPHQDSSLSPSFLVLPFVVGVLYLLATYRRNLRKNALIASDMPKSSP